MSGLGPDAAKKISISEEESKILIEKHIAKKAAAKSAPEAVVDKAAIQEQEAIQEEEEVGQMEDIREQIDRSS